MMSALPPTGGARLLAVATLVDSVGSGLFLAGSVVFFVRGIGLSAAQVGLGVSVAGAIGFLTAVPIGAVADRLGPKRILVVLHVWRAVAFCSYALVDTYLGFLVVVILAAIADRGASPITQALVAVITGSDQRVRTMAYLRALKNAGFAVGALLTAPALQIDTRAAYNSLVIGDGLSFLLTAALVAKLPVTDSVRSLRSGKGGLAALKGVRRLGDTPYLALTGVNTLLVLHDTVFLVGLPLWVVQHTQAPRALVSTLLAVNTALVVLFQVRASRGASTAEGSGQVLGRSGLVLAGACGLIAVAGWLPSTEAAGILLVGATVLTFGELLQSAGAWGLSFELAPEEMRSRYLSVFSLSMAAQRAFGPILVTTVVIQLEAFGWALLATIFLLAGVAARRVGVWALATREEAQSPQASPATA